MKQRQSWLKERSTEVETESYGLSNFEINGFARSDHTTRT